MLPAIRMIIASRGVGAMTARAGAKAVGAKAAQKVVRSVKDKANPLNRGPMSRVPPVRTQATTLGEAATNQPSATMGHGAGDHSVHHGRTTANPTSAPSPITAEAIPVQPKDSKADIATRLLLGGQFVRQNLNSFVPSITWTGGISARGYKSTPQRTVLHYCLAVVFGVVHQSRIGSTSVNVDLFPNENRVEVTFTSSSVLGLEGTNVALILGGRALGLVDDDIPNADKRPVGETEEVKGSIRKFLEGAINPVAGLKDWMNQAGNVGRLLGPAGIWDMAQSNIYAGIPPATMTVKGMQPFTDIYDWSVKEKRPMLTRQLAVNPQGEPVDNMHYPTHLDLRSLVAQALYDPGVLPPPPDTVVALPNADW